MDLKEELSVILKGDVADDEATLKKYSNDASIFEVKPRLVVFPKDRDDIKALVRFVQRNKKEKLSLTCRSGGTDMSGGPLNESIIVDVSRYMNRLKEMQEDYAIVEPGLFHRDFEKEAKKLGVIFPSYPASKDICTFGGIVNNNSGGEKSLVYGKTENYVEEMKVVLQDGEEYILRPLSKKELTAKMRKKDFEGEFYRKLYALVDKNHKLLQEAKPDVSKNSAGYFLWNVWDKKTFDPIKLFVGAQGTLGIMTEARIRLVRPKPHSALLVMFLRDLDPLADIVKNVLEHKPESFESYDDHTLKLAIRFFPDMLKLMGAKNIFSLMFRFLPEMKLLLTGGLPKIILLAEFTAESKQAALDQAREAKESLEGKDISMRIAGNKADIQKYFTIRRQSFSLLRQHIKKKKSAPFIDDIVVLPEKLPEFLPELNKILAKYPNLIYTIAGHVGNGNFHIIPLMDLSNPDRRKIIPELSKKVYDLVFRYEGSMSGEHNDGLIRTPYLERMYGKKVVSLFKETKDIFDPHSIFNPKKKVGADLKYSTARIMTHN